MAFAKFFRGREDKVDPRQPDEVWNKIKKSQRVDVVAPLSFGSPKPSDHTRFVCLSDTHTMTRRLQVPEGDVLLHAGDFTEFGETEEVTQFRDFLLSLTHPYKVVIAGNHEHTFDVGNYEFLRNRFELEDDCHTVRDILIKAPGITYLEDSEIVINGIKIWGSPWQPWFNDWAFNLSRGDELQRKWDKIPNDVDILMTHGPPLGHGDRNYERSRVGCYNLLKTVQERVRPRYHVFGHVHEDYGITTDGHTCFVNVAICDFYKRPRNKPIIFDIPNKK